ncbi:MAG: hypothetical protein ACYDC8_16965 [Gammaproteobacteria bacterium]
MLILPEQPQSIGKTLDSGIKLYLASFKSIILLSLLYGFISIIPQLLMARLAPALRAGHWGSVAPAILVVMLFSVFLVNAMVYRIGMVARGTPAAMGVALRLALKRLAPVVFGSILYGLSVALGMVLLIIPGIILMFSLFFFSVAIVLDGVGMRASLALSHRLVWGNWWRTTTILSVVGIISLAFYFGLAALLGLVVAISVGNNPALIQQLLQPLVAVFSAVLTPLFYSILVVLYHDLKIRKQGTDLATRMEGAFVAA